MKTILFNPFERYSERILLPIGIVFTILASAWAFAFNARFDGVLDFHFAKEVSFLNAFLDNVIDVFALFIFLFLVGKYFNKKTRAIDIMVVTLVARLPYYILPIFNVNNYMAKTSESLVQQLTEASSVSLSGTGLTTLLLFTLISLLCLIWYIALLYNGFKTATNAKSTKSIIFFVIGVLLAEVLSKYVITLF